MNIIIFRTIGILLIVGFLSYMLNGYWNALADVKTPPNMPTKGHDSPADDCRDGCLGPAPLAPPGHPAYVAPELPRTGS